jgi:signal transduction histidine kinase/Tfp pilus assembly protein PilF
MFKSYLCLLTAILLIQSFCLGQSQDSESYQSDTAYINGRIDICRKVLYLYPDSASDYLDSIFYRSKKIDYEYGLYISHTFRGSLLWLEEEMDKALIEYKLALKYSNGDNFPARKANALGNIALVYTRKLEVDSAKKYLSKTIEYSEENNIPKMYRKGLFDLGILYLGQDNYIEASRNLLKVRNELETVEDLKLKVHVYNSFGILYTKLNNFDSALCYYNKAIEFENQLGAYDLRSSIYTNIGELYFRQNKGHDSAIHFFLKAEKSAGPNRYNAIKLNTNINLGNVFFDKIQLDSTRKYYEDALNSPLIDKFPISKTAVLVNLGIYNLEVRNHTKAQFYLDSGYAMASEFGILRYKNNALKALCFLDSLNGNFLLSLKHYKEYHSVSDALSVSEANKEIAIFEFDKYVNQEKLNNLGLVKENEAISRRMILSVVIIVILLILLYALLINSKKRKRLLEQVSESRTNLQTLNEELEIANNLLSEQQAELKALNLSKDKLFSVLGHDLKSPFNGIIGLLELVNANWDIIEDTEKKEMLGLLFASSERVSELLDNILNWGKTQVGMVNIDTRSVVLYPTIKEIVDLLEARIENKKLHLEIELSNETLSIDTDVMLFSRIVQNLINNAIKFTPKEGRISVKVEQLSKEIKISVIDSGIGIPKEKVSTIFDMNLGFRRPGTDGEKSTGMGLLLSKEYAKLIGASLTVSSAEGEGSSFVLTFPL